VRKPAPLDVIQAGGGSDPKLVRVDDVLYFESEGRSTRVVYRDADGDGELLIRTSMKELVGLLDPVQFWQVHRSAIVNQRCVERALRVDGNMVLTLQGRSEKLPVARHFQGQFPQGQFRDA
jgi:DNA-binding LytR/AlgR family response regulator